MKQLLLITLLLCFAFTMQSKAQSASLKSYEIYAAAHGFMCPFLTPKLIQRIQSMDSCKVWRTDDLIIHVEFSKPTAVNEEQLLNAAEKTGYERKNISIKEIANQ